MKIALAVVALLVLAAGAQLVLETTHRPAAVVSPTLTASASASATPTSKPTPERSPSATATPSVPTPPTPAPPTVTISGAGSGHSKSVILNDTTGYLARYTLGSSCQYDAHLRLADDSYDNADFIVETGPMSSTKIMNNVLVGNFYIAMTTGRGCSWSVTFVPR
jgi:hypothetical protein